MYRKVISKAEAVWRNMVQARCLVVRKVVLRFSGRTNRHILFEFLVLIGLLSSVGIIAASQWSTTIIASHGNLRVNGVGVYNDSNCSVATTYLDWGTLEPGTTRNIVVYVRNEGNHVASLSLAVDNWNPTTASDYMSVCWNYDGRTLSPMENTEVTLTLSVSEEVTSISSFSFELIIGAA